jgi:hypothetical protein
MAQEKIQRWVIVLGMTNLWDGDKKTFLNQVRD